MGTVTVGLDIGTTSIKAVAVDDDGQILSRARIPHPLRIPAPDLMQHDADRAWRRGPRRALAAMANERPAAVAVTAMVPSLTAVDKRGRPLTPGLLYGDARGRGGALGEVEGFLRWTAGQAPDAYGYWLAQSVANRALGGAPTIDLAVALTCGPLYGPQGWDEDCCADIGVKPDQLSPAELPGAAAGQVDGDGPVLSAGTVDVWCEQLVAGAEELGDVHVICGTTLIVWAVVPGGGETPSGLWVVPHRSGVHQMAGGASNAGGLFLDWVRRTFPVGRRPGPIEPGNVPVWTPYPRGERTPYHDPDRRAGLHDLDLSHTPEAIQRAAYEASGFVVRHHLDLAGVTGRRIIATGGGTRVDAWMHAMADATGLPVHVAADPEGAARGAAFLARMAAGVETDLGQAAAWAATGRVFEPDRRWSASADDRYRRFRELSGAVT
jgi:xylulokinase